MERLLNEEERAGSLVSELYSRKVGRSKAELSGSFVTHVSTLWVLVA